MQSKRVVKRLNREKLSYPELVPLPLSQQFEEMRTQWLQLHTRKGVGHWVEATFYVTMSLVNCEMKSRCLSCHGECLSDLVCNENINGLWSVKTVKTPFNKVTKMFDGKVNCQ